MTRDGQLDHIFIPGHEILRPIGRGGMGDVLLARQLSLGRLVALKILATTPGADATEQAARFRREAELMARVHHPNIVPVHDFGSVEGRLYLVMEYVEGGDLRRQMVPGRPMPVHQVRPLVLPVTQALACLHAHGILHRDLKPENILMHHEVTPMLSDFGLAVLDSDAGMLTQADQALGTLGYVAPEQQYRLGVDERTDQYSMAALMYELLTGHRPLGIFKPPSQLNPALGPGVDAVLMRALQEDPDDRYPAIQEFGAALERALSHPAGRPRLGPISAALIAVAVMIIGAVGLWAALGRPFFMWGEPVGHGKGKGMGVQATRTIAPDPAAPGRPPSPVVTPGPAADAPPARLTNSLGMSLVLVPAGRFVMGASRSDDLAGDDERPEHPVRISRPFYMGVTEVTVGQFRDFVVATGYRTEAETNGKGGIVYNPKKKLMVQDPQFDWRSPGLPRLQGDDEPVVQVSWNDAMAFCRWLSDREHRTYRLPTEAEWEYACRAGSTTRWCMGDDPADLARLAWAQDGPGSSTHPVGRKRPNALDLCDMHGNVWEWCLDWYGPYPDKPEVDPSGPASGEDRVLRGGTFVASEIRRTRSSARTFRAPSFRYFRLGFRVCCSLAEAGKAEGQ